MSNEEISLMVAKDKDEIFRPFGGIDSSQLALLSDGRYVLLTNKTKQEEQMKTETETAKLVMWLLEKNRLTLRYLSRTLGYSL